MSTSNRPRKSSESTKRNGAERTTRRPADTAPRARRSKKPIDRPFDPKIIKRAKDIAATYRIVIHTDEDLGYFGTSVEMPTVMADGATVEACVAELKEALIGAVATMLEMGDKPPLPASSGKREQQVNIRMTADERMRIEEAARQAGFRSVSDFIRAAALKAAS